MSDTKQTVLIIEDEKINRQILKGILRQDFSVLEAENGLEAFSVLSTHPEVVAILCDLLMPTMDGYTFLEKLKSTPYANIPCIAVTGENEEISEQKVLDLGAWDFVTKPYQPMTLVTRLKSAIRRSHYYQIGYLALHGIPLSAGFLSLDSEGKIKMIGLNDHFRDEIAPLYPDFQPSEFLLKSPFDPSDSKMIRDKLLEVAKAKDCLYPHDIDLPKVRLTISYWGTMDCCNLILLLFRKK